jgi:hypothetical protein
MRQSALSVTTLGICTLALGLFMALKPGFAASGNVGRACNPTDLQAQNLVKVTAESRPGVTYTLSVITDSQADVTGLLYNGSHLGPRCFTLTDIQKNAVLVNLDGRDIILVRSLSDLDGFRGGSLELKYLHDGITGSYRTFPMTLERTGKWRLQNRATPFNTLHFPKRTNLLGITVGVQAPVTSWK